MPPLPSLVGLLRSVHTCFIHTCLIQHLCAPSLHPIYLTELRLIRTNPQFELTVNPDGNTPTEIMHVDLQHSVLPALDAAKAECKKKVHAVREEQLTVKAQANQADDEVMEKKSHLQHMAEGIRNIEAEAEPPWPSLCVAEPPWPSLCVAPG